MKMGYLTTFSIYNDDLHEIERNKEEFAEAVIKSSSSIHDNGRVRIGNTSVSIITQKPRHSDLHTLFMQAGNTVVDVYDLTSEWARDQFIKEMEYHIKRLKQMKKDGIIKNE